MLKFFLSGIDMQVPANAQTLIVEGLFARSLCVLKKEDFSQLRSSKCPMHLQYAQCGFLLGYRSES
jgi:hypothetical protein